MSGPVTDAHLFTYQQNVELALQQKRSKFESAVTFHPNVKGRQAMLLDLIMATAAERDAPRGSDTPDIDNDVEPVWVVPHMHSWGKLIEREDAIKALTDFESPFVQSGAAALARAYDDEIIDAIYADRKIGQDGGTTSAWDSTNKLVANTVGSTDGLTAVGLNVAKVLRGKRYLQAFEVDIDMETIFCAVNAQQMEELYTDVKFISADYRDVKVLDATRQVTAIAGVQFIHSERVDEYDSTNWNAAMWVKSGLHWAEFDPVFTRAPENPQKRNRRHPYMERWVGATRSEDKKVVKIRTLK